MAIITTASTVTFTANAACPVAELNGPYTHTWTFTDGTGATSGSPVTHQFSTSGDKTATVTTINTATGSSKSASATVHVFNFVAGAQYSSTNDRYAGGTLVKLPSGKVLIVGSYEGPKCKTFDPSTNTFSNVPDLPNRGASTASYGIGACLLKDGTDRVFACGGNSGLAPAFYSETTNTWTAITGTTAASGTAMASGNPGNQTTCLALPNGKVFITGSGSGGNTPTAWIYDPVTNSTVEVGGGLRYVVTGPPAYDYVMEQANLPRADGNNANMLWAVYSPRALLLRDGSVLWWSPYLASTGSLPVYRLKLGETKWPCLYGPGPASPGSYTYTGGLTTRARTITKVPGGSASYPAALINLGSINPADMVAVELTDGKVLFGLGINAQNSAANRAIAVYDAPAQAFWDEGVASASGTADAGRSQYWDTAVVTAKTSAPAGYDASRGGMGVLVEGIVIVFGSTSAKVFAYDPAGDAWTQITNAPSTPDGGPTGWTGGGKQSDFDNLKYVKGSGYAKIVGVSPGLNTARIWTYNV